MYLFLQSLGPTVILQTEVYNIFYKCDGAYGGDKYKRDRTDFTTMCRTWMCECGYEWAANRDMCKYVLVVFPTNQPVSLPRSLVCEKMSMRWP